MTAAQWLLNAAVAANPIVLIVAGLVALAAGLVIAWQHSQTFRDIVTGVWNVVKGVVVGAGRVIQGAIGGIIGAFQTVIGVLNDIIGVASAAVSAVASVFKANTGPSSIGNNPAAAAARAGHSSIPRYASGGIVSGPAGAPQLAIVHGGETVIPVGGGGGGRGDIVVPITLQVDGQTFMEIIQRYAIRDLRNGGFGVPGAVPA